MDGLARLFREGAVRSKIAFGLPLFCEDQFVASSDEEAVTLLAMLDDQLATPAEKLFARHRLRLDRSRRSRLGIGWA
jgi:hypothetical protein